jgi:hypothetical protein
MKMTDEEAVLRRMGIDYQAPAAGCCGMAGAFGFEADKYEVSMDVGELELLPAVRKASPELLIIADGFSCREQIAQGTNRQALHLAEVIQTALEGGASEAYPERDRVARRRAEVLSSMKKAGLGVAAATFGTGMLWMLSRKRQ